VRVLITGIAGFLGRHVAADFHAHGHDVAGFDLRPSPDFPTAIGDLADASALAAAVAGVDCVCHLGGVGDVYRAADDPPGAALANAVGSANVAAAAERAGGCRIVYASTWEVYGRPRYQPVDEEHPCDPDHPYNVTKYAGERLVLAYDRLRDVPSVALRLGTAFGAGMRPNSVFSLFVDRARAGQPIVIQGSGEQTRQFTHARDIARAFRLAAESDLRGLAINAVSAECTSIRRLAELVAARFPTTIEHRPPRPGDIAPAVVSAARASALLGWEARVSFEDGLRELLDAAAGPASNGVAASADRRPGGR
jgi:UDP-glucose 4-epimerase